MQPLWRHPAALSAVLVLVSGAVQTPKTPGHLRRKASALLAHRQKSHAPSWDYGDLGGSGWSNVGYARCALNGQQSPVNVSAMLGQAGASKLFYRYRSYNRAIPLFNDGRLVAWTVQEWRSEEVGHVATGAGYPHELTDYYSLFQVVVHTPSEHTFGGARVPLELQLYHKKMTLEDGVPTGEEDGEAVVAIGFEESIKGSSLLSALASHGVPIDVGHEILGNNDGDGIDFSSLFKKDPDDGAGSGESAAFLEYEGSLTTPPCDTGVKWFVRADPLPADHEVLEKFRAAADAVAGARDAGAGNARALQQIGSRTGTWLDATDATALRTAEEVHDTMAINKSPKDHTAPVVPDPEAEAKEIANGEPAAEQATWEGEKAESADSATEPVKLTEDGGPAEVPSDHPMACQVNFQPSDVGAILCCWSETAINTAPDMIIQRNGKYVEAQQEVASVEKDLADAENNKNEQCDKMKNAQSQAETSEGAEAMEANQKASTYSSGCEEAQKMVTDLSNEKESWSAKVMGIRGQIEAAIGKAKDEMKNKPGGFACTQESVEIVTAKAAATDPARATVDVGHTFPRYLAPGNPKLIAGGDSGLVEMQMRKHQRAEMK